MFQNIEQNDCLARDAHVTLTFVMGLHTFHKMLRIMMNRSTATSHAPKWNLIVVFSCDLWHTLGDAKKFYLETL